MDIRYMKKAIALAKRATGRTSPNPLVGAVVVRKGEIVGTGYHHKSGEPHAEIIALERAGDLSRGAELYVNLEPCNHRGQTPPCTEAIIKAGIKRVFIAIRDPNPLVNGKGIAKLRENGIEVYEGLLKEEAFKINEIFFKYIHSKLPFVALKTAISIDGRIATKAGESRWITGEKARRHGHTLRNIHDAILVGIGTVKRDNPHLTCRLPGKKVRNPIRIILDSKLSIDYDARVFDSYISAPIIIATTNQAPLHKLEQIQKKAKVLVINEGLQVDLSILLKRLGEMEITSILVEGGSRINGSFLAANLADKYYCYISPIIIGGDRAPGAFGGEGIRALTNASKLMDVSVKHLGEDLLITGYFKKQHYRSLITVSRNLELSH